jgi:hypothetical protein
MQNQLPSNYSRSQNSNAFAFLYGTGYEMENLKQTIGQSEANNYLYSPSTQDGQITVSGAGRYLIEFDVPYVVPPLNVSIAPSSNTDAFIEFTSRFGMTINITTDSNDIISWKASGQLGAATSEFCGDALYNNFGSLFSFPRSGESVINDTFVSQYESFDSLIKVENMTTVLDFSTWPSTPPHFNPPPPNSLRGTLRATTVSTNPGASHELLDANGKIIALLSFDVNQFVIKNNLGVKSNVPVSGFLPATLYATYGAGVPLPTYDVYVSGSQTTFNFNRWNQLSFQQEVFRADNVYRRLLAGINRSLKIGPTVDGISNIFETIFGQPYIPQDIWEASDFRVFKNAKYLTYTHDINNTITAVNSPSQKDGYPAVPPIVEVLAVTSDWTPETLTYNNKPITATISDVPAVQVKQLNIGTQFDITNEVVRQLRVGLDLPTGGIVDWNYLLNVNVNLDAYGSPIVNNQFYTNGVISNNQTYQYNYFFLNNANDSTANITMFYYSKQNTSDGHPHQFIANGPLTFNRDFFSVATSEFYDATTNGGKGGYWLPAELLVNYACNSNLPALASNGELIAGSNYIYKDPAVIPNAIVKPQLPAVVIRLDLTNGNYTPPVPSLSVPTSPTLTPSTAGGTLLAGTNYNYRIAAINVFGSTLAGPEASTNAITTGSTSSIAISWTAVSGAISYEIYGRIAGSELLLATVAGTSYIDTGAITPAGVLPLSDTTGFVNGTKFPATTDDFILYSYAQVSCNPGSVNGEFLVDSANSTLVEYYDARSGSTVQPSNSPFIKSNVQLAQGSFGRFVSDSGMNYVTTMVGGQVTFNKTVTVSSLLSATPINNVAVGPAGVLVMQVVNVGSATGTNYEYSGDTFAVKGTIVRNINNSGRPYFQVDNTNFLLLNTAGFPCAIIAGNSPIDVTQYVNDPTPRTFTGLVGSLLWDTRIPVTQYSDTSPVFQVSDNFDVAVIPFTPNLAVASSVVPTNQNFLVLIEGLPLGNQQTVTASWTFNVQQGSTVVPTQIPGGVPVLLFPDTATQPGIMTYFTGNKLLRDFSIDPDNAEYTQGYVSPIFDGYFIDYKDYLNTTYGNGVQGGKLSAQGDGSNFDTVFSNQTTPGSAATILNFFSPNFGLFSLSILPGMEFYRGINKTPISVVRPRNQGIALRIKGDSYAGLSFYGRNDDKIIDKPTRMLVDFTYTASAKANRHRIVEIADDTFAGWVDGLHPDAPQTGSTFYLAGNQFKYASMGQDQAPNGYAQNVYPVIVSASSPQASQRYSLSSNPPIFETDSSMVQFSTPTTKNVLTSPAGSPGYPQRYRRPPVITIDASGNEHFDQTYQNTTPEKIAYFRFDFNSFPVDTLVKTAIMEVYFCSGFTITEAMNKNATLSYNKLWSRSRLSGNGRVTSYQIKKSDGTLRTVYRPLNNIHWRKNFFEVLLPYAFDGQQNNLSYGIRNLFQPSDPESIGVVQYPPSGLQYLGSVNLDEISIQPLVVNPNLYLETTEGLSNIILTNDSQVFQIFGTLQSLSDGTPDISTYNNTTQKGLPLVGTFVDPNGLYEQINNISTYGLSTSFRYATPIDITAVLPNMKCLIFPFGANVKFDVNDQPYLDVNAEFIYGYVKSFVPPSPISFDSSSISLYKKLINYVCPLYAQYDIKLLESDTYFPFTSFGKTSAVDGTNEDISF